MLIVNAWDLRSFTILIVVVLTQYNIRAQRDVREDLKEQYKFYLDLRVYSSYRE